MIEKFYKELVFQLPIYLGKIVFVDTNDTEELKKRHSIELRRKEPYAHIFEVLETDDSLTEYYYVVVLNTKSEIGNIGMGCLTHECFHLTSFILEDRGVHADYNNDEAQAYLLQYLVNKATVFYYDYTLKKNKE